MRQVPSNYGIIGAGKMARHFSHYLDLLKISYQQWSRNTDPEFKKIRNAFKDCNPILLLISDTAIEPFIQQHTFLKNKNLIHFSGSLVTPLATSTHPLMTFSDNLYSLETYRTIPFVLEQNSKLSDLLPGLKNSSYVLKTEQKALYHALCVLSGNFTVLLWQKFFAELEESLNLPKAIAFPYLEQITKNLQQDGKVLTGPLARGDQTTIQANLTALSNDPFQKIYQAFLETYNTLNKEGL